MGDLEWRVDEGERKIAAKYEPGLKAGVFGGGPAAHRDMKMELQLQPSISAANRYHHDMRRKLVDETEAGIELQPERVLGMMVRYPKMEMKVESDSEEEEEQQQRVVKKKKDVATKKREDAAARGTF